eukprot:Opistho-2@57101
MRPLSARAPTMTGGRLKWLIRTRSPCLTGLRGHSPSTRVVTRVGVMSSKASATRVIPLRCSGCVTPYRCVWRSIRTASSRSMSSRRPNGGHTTRPGWEAYMSQILTHASATSMHATSVHNACTSVLQSFDVFAKMAMLAMEYRAHPFSTLMGCRPTQLFWSECDHFSKHLYRHGTTHSYRSWTLPDMTSSTPMDSRGTSRSSRHSATARPTVAHSTQTDGSRLLLGPRDRSGNNGLAMSPRDSTLPMSITAPPDPTTVTIVHVACTFRRVCSSVNASPDSLATAAIVALYSRQLRATVSRRTIPSPPLC